MGGGGADRARPSGAGMSRTEWLASRRGHEVRRAVGPVAWVVLEETVAATDDTGEASVSARGLGEALGLGKDAVARALARLCGNGLLHRVDQKRTRGGRFDTGAYALGPCIAS